MKCNETEQYIKLYIDDELTGAKLREFLAHIEGCPTCYEEMEINYLIKEALSRLEDGTTFDLQKELILKLQNSKRCLAIYERLIVARHLILATTIGILFITLIKAVLLLEIGIF